MPEIFIFKKTFEFLSIKFINFCHHEEKFSQIKKFLFIESFFIVDVDPNDMQSRGKMEYKKLEFFKSIKSGAKRAIKKWGEREILFFI